MKKITLFLMLLCFSVAVSAQVLNQPAAWPNTNWTVTGVFNPDPSAFEADPTATSNFAFDDDDAGGTSDDDIAAESPIIDLSAAFGAGETWLFIDVDYTYNDLADVLNLEYWDADSSTWEVWQQFVASADEPDDNFCSGARDSFTSNQLNIAGFTANQLSNFQYRIAFYDDGPGGGAAWEWGFCFDSPTITSQTPPICPDPDMLEAVNITETTADLQWTENGSATVWNIEWGLAGFTPGSGTTVNGITAIPYNLTGLTAGTGYDFYIQSDCGGSSGTSNFIGPFTFATAVPGGACNASFAMNVEPDCSAATPVTFDFSLAEDIDANGENPTCDGAGNWGYWINFTAPAIGSVIFEFGGGADEVGLEILDACGGTSLVCFNNDFNDGDNSGIIDGLTPGNTYVAVIWRDGQSGSADVCIEEGPTCIFPSDLSASNFTIDGADLSWTENGTATVWNVEVVLAGDPPTGTPTSTGVTNPYTVTGLMPNTDYDFYVQADCGGGDTSDFSGPFTFTTACDIFTPDYIEQFNTITPDCWEEADSGDATTGPGDLGGSSWVEDGFINNGTTGAYKINLWLASKSDWILSPTFDLTGGPFQVEFDFAIMEFASTTTAGTLGSDDTVQLLITNDDGATWTTLVTYDSSSVVPATGETVLFTLEAYAGQTVRFGILGSEGTVDDPEDNDVFVDNFRVRGIPTCPEPINLDSNNLSLTETEVSWTETGTSTVWNIEYGPSGFTPGTGTLVSGVTTNPYTISPLLPDTDYDFYVQAECDPMNLSSFAGPASFFTGYCQSEPSSLDGTGVNNVTIETIDFPSLGDLVTYEDQTSPTIDVFPGINTEVIIEFGHAFDYNTNIWIDFDDNLVFDASELVFQGESSGAGDPHTLDASFVMPVTATPGVHRMRIGTADTGQATPNPCYNGTWGVTLDFTVNVGILPCVLPEVSFNIVDDCDSQQFFIDVDVTDLGDATSIEISNDFDANTIQIMAAGISQIGPFPSGTAVVVSVANEQESLCTIVSPELRLICPPDNDTPCEANVAVVNDGILCENNTPGSIFGASPSGVPDPSCGGSADDDVWFQFEALSEFQLISLANVVGSSATDMDLAVYEGTCDNLTEIACVSGFEDWSLLTPSVTIGETYYVRVYSGGTTQEDTTFDLCITTYLAPPNIDCESTENLCSGGNDDNILYYNNVVGLPDTSTLDCLITIPNPTYFELPIGETGDILIEMVQNSAFDADGNPIGDELDVDFLLWGPLTPDDPVCVNQDPFTISAPVVDCSYSFLPVENAVLTGAQAGEVYLLLITNFESEPGVIQVIQTNLGDSGAGAIVADITAEITSQQAFIDPNNDFSETDVVPLCGFTEITLETDSPGADEFVWFKNGIEITGETSSTLTVTESDTYQVLAIDNGCAAEAFSQFVEVNLYEDPGNFTPDPLIVCDGATADGVEDFNLEDITAALGFGPAFTVTYYTNMADANQAMNPVTSPYNSGGEILVVRVEDTNAANNGFLGCRQLGEVELIVNANPVINQPADFVVCDDLDGIVDGVTEFDLTSIDSEVTTDPNVTVTYHNTQADAETGTDALVSPYSSSGETVFVRAQDNTTGCFSTTSFNLVINVVPLGSIDTNLFYYDPDTDEFLLCPQAGSGVVLTLIPDSSNVGTISVQWLLDGIEIAGATGLSYEALSPGDYTARITFDDTGCSNSISDNVVTEIDNCVIPEGISPGVSPGFNDTFDLRYFNVTRLDIFNRNGTLVYSKDNYTDEWEGQTNDGEELPVGTYFYTMTYEGGTKQKSAWVYINR